MLALRVASTVIGVPILLAVIWLGGYAFSIGTGVLLTIGALEFYSAVSHNNPGIYAQAKLLDRLPKSLAQMLAIDPLAYLGAAFVALLMAGAHASGVGSTSSLQAWWTGALAGAALLGWTWLILEHRTESALTRWLWFIGGVIYVGWLGSHLVLLRDMDDDGDWVFMTIGATFMADTAAYFVGRAIGRHRLAPRISPGKTIEGAIGGIIAGWAGLILLNYITGLRLDAQHAVAMGLLLTVATILGDLAESLLKRSIGVKDTGALVPGHGGVLDRFDSVLFVGVVIYYYGQWFVL